MKIDVKIILVLVFVILLFFIHTSNGSDHTTKDLVNRLEISLKKNKMTLEFLRLAYRKLNDVNGQLTCLNESIYLYETNRDFHDIFPPIGLGLLYGRRWMIYEELGKHDAAKAEMNEALTIFSKIEDREEVNELFLRNVLKELDSPSIEEESSKTKRQRGQRTKGVGPG